MGAAAAHTCSGGQGTVCKRWWHTISSCLLHCSQPGQLLMDPHPTAHTQHHSYCVQFSEKNTLLSSQKLTLPFHFPSPTPELIPCPSQTPEPIPIPSPRIEPLHHTPHPLIIIHALPRVNYVQYCVSVLPWWGPWSGGT